MKKFTPFLIATIAVVLAGCATHTSETESVRKPWNLGDTATAEEKVSSLSEEYKDTGDSLVWQLEEGAVARANANFKKSVEALESANNSVKKFESEAETSLTQETSAFLTNQSYIPYKGYNYDKIMMSVYLALNYIELKDFDNARVQFNRLENYQKNSIEKNRKRIEKEQEAIEKATNSKKSSQNIDNAKQLAYQSNEFQQYYGDAYLPKTEQQAKILYVNPFAYWISGVFFLNKAEDTADKERAQDMFRIGGEISGNKSSIFVQDFKRCEDVLSGKPVENITYIVYETGCAPIRKQFRLDLPLFIASGNLPYVAVNFPYISLQDSYKPDLSICAGGKNYTPETITDMDSIIKEEFDNELPMLITKTLLSSAAKASAQYFAAQAAGDWGVLVNIAGGLYQSMMNDSDLRTWTTLPKQIKVARIATPQDGVIIIDGKQIKVSKNPVNVIVAKRMSANGKLLLRAFDFSAATTTTKQSSSQTAATSQN